MGSGRTGSTETPSTASPQETALRPPKPIASSRHVLPSDLPSAIKHLNDQELEQLLAAVTAERQRRGKKLPASDKTVSKRAEEPSTTLTIGKLNAVRAAYQAGVKPSKIAKQFGIPQADVRKVIANEGIKR
jgi:uncharacterized protein YkwD